jgi:cytochrome c556
MTLSSLTTPLRRLGIATLIVSGALAGRSSQSAEPSIGSTRPTATLQTIMKSEIDASADFVWDSVETIVTRRGERVRQPHTAAEWAAVRRRAATLIEGSEQLAAPHRRVSKRPFAAEAQGALDSAQIQERIDSNWPTFLAFAQALERTAKEQLRAIDDRDVAALVAVGGQLDAVCEACHLGFWYPNQVIPPLPPQVSAR